MTFTSTIYPIDAKGMVEKWLLQVKIVVNKMLFDSWHQDDGEQDVVWHQGGGEQDLWDDALHQDCWDQDEFQVEKQMVRSLRDTIEKAVAVITLLYVTSSLYQLWPR